LGRCLGGGTVSASTPIYCTHHPQGYALVDAGGGHFGFDPRSFQLGEHLFRADAMRFRDLVNPLLCH